MSPTKNLQSNTFQFFYMQTKRLAVSFEGLNNSSAQLAGELQSFNVAQKYGLNEG